LKSVLVDTPEHFSGVFYSDDWKECYSELQEFYGSEDTYPGIHIFYGDNGLINADVVEYVDDIQCDADLVMHPNGKIILGSDNKRELFKNIIKLKLYFGRR